jgi:uncharacterized membrane protein YeaQ/YmgE (transglycosylase-associated protein family)
MTTFIFQLIGGALAGYAAGHYWKGMNLSDIGNPLVGALGGVIGGQILFAILGLSGTTQVVSAVLVGAIGGALAMFLATFVRSKLST